MSEIQGRAQRALSVLVVEDEEVVATAIGAALRRRGHRVELVRSVAEALAQAPFDVLVVDLRLSDGSGLDLLEQLRARGKESPVVLLSGLPTFADCQSALRLGAADFLAKPFALDELLAAIESAARTAPADAPAVNAPASFRADYPLVPASVEQAVRDLAAFALRRGIGPASRMRVASACAEMLENAVLHAGAHDGARVHVQATLDEADTCPELSVEISDQGRGFDAVNGWVESVPSLLAGQRTGAPAEQAGGLVRAASLAEDLRVASSASGTTVRLRFTCVPASFPEDPAIDLSELDWLAGENARRVLRALGRGQSDAHELVNISPAMAVTVGRLLAGRTPAQVAQIALWS